MVTYNNKLGLQVIFKKGSLLRHAVYHAILYSIVASIVVLFDIYCMDIKVSITPWVIVGSALGLLLVFRTNTAYDRYWEGRKAIGEINTTLRSLATVLMVLSNDRLKQERWICLLGLFMFLVKIRLWNESSKEFFDKYVEELTDKQMIVLKKSDNPPLSLILVYKQILVEQKLNKEIDNIIFTHIDNLFNTLIKAVGVCERIKKTPIPFPYHVHIKSLLTIFCITLPLALVDSMGFISILACAFVTFAFVGIEEIGVEIEDPFGIDVNDFDLAKYANDFQKELKEAMII